MFATQPFLVLAELSTNCQRRVVLHPPDLIIFASGRYLAKGANNDATEPIKKVGAVALAGSIALSPSFGTFAEEQQGVLAAAGTLLGSKDCERAAGSRPCRNGPGG